MVTKTLAVQIEGLTKDVKYMREKIDDGFKTTHEKQDKTNGRLLKLEENEKSFLPKADFQKFLDEEDEEDSDVKKEKIISKRDITVAIIGAVVSAIALIVGYYVSLKGGV